MLLFIYNLSFSAYLEYDFKTSYVTVYLMVLENISMVHPYFKTSYVTVYQKTDMKSNGRYLYFKTSYVTVYQF